MSKKRSYNRSHIHRQVRETGSKLAQEVLQGGRDNSLGRVNQASPTGEILTPTTERGQHNPIELYGRQILDSKGDIGVPFYSVDTIEILRRRESISHEEYLAGLKFAADFYISGLQAVRAAPYEKLGKTREYLTEKRMSAQNRLYRAQTALGGIGSPIERIIYQTMGEGKNLTEIGNVRTNRKRLIEGLRTLSVHYGFSV